MITTTGLTKRFGKNEVLTNIDLHVDAKDIVVLLGPSGSGKSTLLRCLNGLEELSGGKIEVNGVVVDSADSQRIQRARVLEIRRQTGMVFQQFNLYPHKTVLGNVMEGLITVKKSSGTKQPNAAGFCWSGSVCQTSRMHIHPVCLVDSSSA